MQMTNRLNKDKRQNSKKVVYVFADVGRLLY